MNFDYLFLAVGEPDFLEELQSQIAQDFPKTQIHSTTSLEDGRDFCQANVYDLILGQANVDGQSIEPMLEGIREMNNDNRDTGALLFGDVKEPIQNLEFTMFSKDLQDYLSPAMTLLSLKR